MDKRIEKINSLKKILESHVSERKTLLEAINKRVLEIYRYNTEYALHKAALCYAVNISDIYRYDLSNRIFDGYSNIYTVFLKIHEEYNGSTSATYILRKKFFKEFISEMYSMDRVNFWKECVNNDYTRLSYDKFMKQSLKVLLVLANKSEMFKHRIEEVECRELKIKDFIIIYPKNHKKQSL